jgi:chromosome segregation ATPase
MVTIEQVKLLEDKVSRAVDYVKRLTDENTLLAEKVENYHARIEELETAITLFKEEQNKIEECVLQSLDQLSKVESDAEARAAETKERENEITDEESAPEDATAENEETPEETPESSADAS